MHTVISTKPIAKRMPCLYTMSAFCDPALHTTARLIPANSMSASNNGTSTAVGASDCRARRDQ